MHPSLAFGLHEFQTAPLSLRLLGPHADDVAGTTTVVHGERLRMLLLVHRPDDWAPAAELGLDARASTALFAARWHAHVSGLAIDVCVARPSAPAEPPVSPSPPSPHRARRWRARRRRTRSRSTQARLAAEAAAAGAVASDDEVDDDERTSLGSLDSRELDSEPGGFEDERALSADESDNDVDDFESSSAADSDDGRGGDGAGSREPRGASELLMRRAARVRLVLDRGGDDADDGAARPSRILAQVGALPRRELRSGDSFELARVREDLRGCVHSAAAALDVADAAADADGAASYSGSGTSGAQGATRVRKTSSMGAALGLGGLPAAARASGPG